MSVKQDRQPVRTAQQLEEKYKFGKQFAEILGIALDARDSVEVMGSELRHEILEQVTSITRYTEQIIMSALESYVDRSDLEEVKTTLESEFKVMAENITMNFYQSTIKTAIEDVDSDLQTTKEELEKHFEFSANGLTINGGENSMSLVIDNDLIAFHKNGEMFGYWDGVDFYTGNIVVQVNERAQFGNFAFVPRSNGSLDFLKVGG